MFLCPNTFVKYIQLCIVKYTIQSYLLPHPFFFLIRSDTSSALKKVTSIIVFLSFFLKGSSQLCTHHFPNFNYERLSVESVVKTHHRPRLRLVHGGSPPHPQLRAGLQHRPSSWTQRASPSAQNVISQKVLTTQSSPQVLCVKKPHC